VGITGNNWDKRKALDARLSRYAAGVRLQIQTALHSGASDENDDKPIITETL
jgi:hypothetical protein